MRLKYAFETVNMGDEYIAVPVGQNANKMGGVLKINETGKEILECLSNETTEDDIIEYLCNKYENSREDLKLLIQDTIDELKDLGLIL